LRFPAALKPVLLFLTKLDIPANHVLSSLKMGHNKSGAGILTQPEREGR
jgi:hypothetical protein